MAKQAARFSKYCSFQGILDGFLHIRKFRTESLNL